MTQPIVLQCHIRQAVTSLLVGLARRPIAELNRKLAVMRAAFDVRQGRLGHWPLWPGKMRDGRTVRLCYPALNRKVALSGLWPSLHTAARSPESADVSLGRSWSRPRSAGARLPARSGRRAAFGIPCRRNAGRAGLFIDRTPQSCDARCLQAHDISPYGEPALRIGYAPGHAAG